MSWNVALPVEQNDHDNEIVPMLLTRASRGITHSAMIGVGDILDFSGIHVEITQIVHKHAPINKPEIAPNSVAYGMCDPLSDSEIDVLRQHGFLNEKGE